MASKHGYPSPWVIRVANPLFVCLCLLPLLAACIDPLRPPPEFAITPARADTRIEPEATANSAVFDVHSPSGIGAAEIELVSGQMPAQLVFRLFLQGLEELRFTFGETVVVASVASTADHTLRQTLTTPDGEVAIAPDHPAWIDIRIVSEDGSPGTIPLRDGYFEAYAPQAFHDAGQAKLSVEWIDFFR